MTFKIIIINSQSYHTWSLMIRRELKYIRIRWQFEVEYDLSQDHLYKMVVITVMLLGPKLTSGLKIGSHAGSWSLHFVDDDNQNLLETHTINNRTLTICTFISSTSLTFYSSLFFSSLLHYFWVLILLHRKKILLLSKMKWITL